MQEAPKSFSLKETQNPRNILKEELESKLPTFSEYIKSQEYVDVKAYDPEIWVAIKEVKYPGLKDYSNSFLADVALQIKDKEGVKFITDQQIDIIYKYQGEAYVLKVSYVTESGVQRTKIVIMSDYNSSEIFGNGIEKINKNIAIRNLTVFKK